MGKTAIKKSSSDPSNNVLRSYTGQVSPKTIDGAVTPNLIPDSTAYGLFFNFFAERTNEERGKLLSYCKQTALARVDLDGVLKAARFYKERVADVDARAEFTRQIETHSLALQKLESLREEREAIVADTIARLPQFVGQDGAQAIRQHIEERIKPRTKIVPGPTMPH